MTSAPVPSTAKTSCVIACAALLLLVAACGGGNGVPGFERLTRGVGTTEAFAYVPGDGGWIGIRVRFPKAGRYPSPQAGTQAPVVVQVQTYLTPQGPLLNAPDPTPDGIIHLTFVWPGRTDPGSGLTSDGMFDYGGVSGLSGFRHVLRFATGQTQTFDGLSLQDLGAPLGILPLVGQVGLYGFSHPGIAATNVIALYGSQVPGVQWFVGRENPTQDVITAVELGHWDPQPPAAVLNPFYDLALHYDATDIDLGAGYAHVDWHAVGDGRPLFDDGILTHMLGEAVPRIDGLRHYSVRLTQALEDNGVFQTWPNDVATPAEAAANWPLRETVHHYADVGTQSAHLKVLLVYAQDDHVQPAIDKPHIHQAFDGFLGTAGLSWVRLNPDRAYVESIYGSPQPGAPDAPANAGPLDWSNVRWTGYPNAAILAAERYPRAAFAEMADRTHYGDWSVNLLAVLP